MGGTQPRGCTEGRGGRRRGEGPAQAGEFLVFSCMSGLLSLGAMT